MSWDDEQLNYLLHIIAFGMEPHPEGEALFDVFCTTVLDWVLGDAEAVPLREHFEMMTALAPDSLTYTGVIYRGLALRSATDFMPNCYESFTTSRNLALRFSRTNQTGYSSYLITKPVERAFNMSKLVEAILRYPKYSEYIKLHCPEWVDEGEVISYTSDCYPVVVDEASSTSLFE